MLCLRRSIFHNTIYSTSKNHTIYGNRASINRFQLT